MLPLGSALSEWSARPSAGSVGADWLTPLEKQLLVDDQKVAAYFTDHQAEPDVAVLVFFLAPPTLKAAG